MSPAHFDQRTDDTATARETACPDCNSTGIVVTRVFSSIDPGAVREFHQTCCVCHGSGKLLEAVASGRE